jgi:predicted site-specific integrase-resolvase
MNSTNATGYAAPGYPPSLSGRKFSKARTIAEKLDVCPKTIFRWAQQGKLTRHKINGRVVLFDEAEIFALLKAARE